MKHRKKARTGGEWLRHGARLMQRAMKETLADRITTIAGSLAFYWNVPAIILRGPAQLLIVSCPWAGR